MTMLPAINPEFLRFLLEQAGTDRVRHSGRTLHEHLCGTHDLLWRWGNRDEVCAAGLFHSIYGTRHFKHRSWPLEQRDVIRNLIGRPAEWLAYLFCATARPKAFVVAATNGQPRLVTDLFRNMELLLTPQELRDLLEIEAANLIDQGSSSRWLLRIRDSGISDAAKREIDHYAHLSGRPDQMVKQTAADRL